jgi:hypothetical protein
VGGVIDLVDCACRFLLMRARKTGAFCKGKWVTFPQPKPRLFWAGFDSAKLTVGCTEFPLAQNCSAGASRECGVTRPVLPQ